MQALGLAHRRMTAADGAAFSLRSFHEAVLAEGSLPLAVLGERLLDPGSMQRARRADLPARSMPPLPAIRWCNPR
jgi:hypothetical protein